MESNRIILVNRRKPRIILDRRFSFFKRLMVGEKGQVDCKLTVKEIEMFTDDNGNEKMRYILAVKKAELINENDSRNT